MTQKNKQKIFTGLAFLTLFLIALGLRLNDMFVLRDFWYDEAFTGILLQSSWQEMNDLIFRDVHPPLYYWLLWPWTKLFGTTEITLRGFSLLFGMLLLPSIFWITKKLFNERSAWLASILYTISPFAILYSSEARMYSLFGFVFLWTFYFFYLALKNNQLRHWIFWGILGGTCFYIHYLSLFFFIVFYCTAFLHKLLFRTEKINSFKRFLSSFFVYKGFWLSTGIIFIFFLSWLRPFLNHIARKGLGWVEVAQLDKIPSALQFFFLGHLPGKIMAAQPVGFQSLHSDFFNYDFGPFFGGNSLGIIILVLLTAGSALLWRKKKIRLEIFVLAMCSLGSLLFLVMISWLGIKLFVARYFLPVAVLVFILIAGILVSQTKKKIFFILPLIIYGLFLLQQKPITYNSDWHQLFNSSSHSLIENQKVIIDNPFDYAVARYYLGQDKIVLFNQYDPDQDFSLWIILDNEGKIDDRNKLPDSQIDFAIARDQNCQWEEAGFKNIGKFGQLNLCRRN